MWIICLAHHKEIGFKMEIKNKGRWRDPGGGAEAGGGLLGDGRQRQRQVEGCKWEGRQRQVEGCRLEGRQRQVEGYKWRRRQK